MLTGVQDWLKVFVCPYLRPGIFLFGFLISGSLGGRGIAAGNSAVQAGVTCRRYF
jgi:hypothetical protein